MLKLAADVGHGLVHPGGHASALSYLSKTFTMYEMSKVTLQPNSYFPPSIPFYLLLISKMFADFMAPQQIVPS